MVMMVLMIAMVMVMIMMMMMVMMMLRVIVIWRTGNICPQHVPQSDSAFLSTEASSLSLSIYMYDHGNGV